MSNGSKNSGGNPKSPTQADKARITSTQAVKNGGRTEKGSFTANIQSAADRGGQK